MFLIGFVKVEKARFLKNPEAKYKATGIGGILGNKGGMNITFEYMGSNFSVLNCHLVHSAKNFVKRNAMIASLLQSFRFGVNELDPEVFSDF